MLRQAVFLVGGLGTRLKDRTRSTPKPLLDVGGKPFIEYLLDEAARHGFTDILLLAGHLGEQFVERYHEQNWRGARMRVLCEPEPLGTGGALRLALPELAPAFLLVNGDSFFDINLRALTASIPPGGLTMALRSGAAEARYGRVGVEGERVQSFHAPQENRDGPINGGIYAMDRAVIEAMPVGKASLEDRFPELAARGLIRGQVFGGYFIDIGVPHDFERAQTELPKLLRRPAVFFDRDGVLNEDSGYVHRKEDFRWLEGAKDAIRLCNDRGAFVFVVTNQAGLARGLYDVEALEALHGWMAEELGQMGAHIDAIEYCPHHPEAKLDEYRRVCRRRKPAPGMILDLLANWPIDKERSFLVGNKQSDLDAASAAGIESHLYSEGDLRRLVADWLDRLKV